VFDRSANFIFYKDGEATVGDDISGATGSLPVPNPYMAISRRPNVDGGYFSGLIDEVTILNTALTAPEIQAQLAPACTCSGQTCQCGDLEVTKTEGAGDLFLYLSNSTISPGETVTMTDYACISETCKYSVSSGAGGQEVSVGC